VLNVKATPHFSPTRFPAPVALTRRAGDFLLSETRYPSEAVLETHAHEYACVVVVLQGSFCEHHGSKTRTAEAGTVIVRPAGEPHSNRFADDGGRCLNVELTPGWLGNVPRSAVRSTASRGGFWSVLGRRLHLELVHEDDVSAMAVESLVLEILVGLAHEERISSGAPPWLLRARDRIHDDPGARVSLAGLAAEAGVHPVHLATTFRRFFGQPVAATIRQLRIERACQELARSDAPIADVAIDAGFADQSHLGRALKQTLRVTPAAYRSASRRGATP
jgi:AraC family transcriptional regulator